MKICLEKKLLSTLPLVTWKKYLVRSPCLSLTFNLDFGGEIAVGGSNNGCCLISGAALIAAVDDDGAACAAVDDGGVVDLETCIET